MQALEAEVDQLKEEIHAKDQNLVREHFDRMKVEKEKEVLRDNLQKLRKREHESEDYLAQMAAETTKLNTIINEADKERQRQRGVRRKEHSFCFGDFLSDQPATNSDTQQKLLFLQD